MQSPHEHRRRGVMIMLAVVLSGLACVGCDPDGDIRWPDPSDTSPGTDTRADLASDTSTEDSADARDGSTNDARDAADTRVVDGSDAVTDTTSDADDMTDTMMPPPEGPARYATDRTHSPLSPWVVDRLRSLRDGASGPDDHVFAKIGDSITVSVQFLHCFASSDPDLLDLSEQADATSLQAAIDHFSVAVTGGTETWNRESIASTVGWSAFSALAGDPSPLDQELAALNPRVAVVMFGTNDIGIDNLEGYAGDMLDIVDQLLARGTIPILSTIPPRDDDPAADAKVPLYNGVVRGIAQGRQVPLVDLHRELAVLPYHGLGPDGVHPTVHRTTGGAARGCWFTRSALEHGYNVRNLLTLQALDRVRRHVLLDAPEPAPDPPFSPIQGDGSPTSPFVIDALPFNDLRSTADSPHRDNDSYGCSPETDESGPELSYRLQLDAAGRIRAAVHDRGSVDVDLHVLDASGDPSTGCLARDHRVVELDLDAGEYVIVVDTYVSGGSELSGEFLLTVDRMP